MLLKNSGFLGMFLITLLNVSQLQAQYLGFTTEVPGDISLCSEGDFTITFQNDFGKRIKNIYVLVEFPEGVEYNGNLSNHTPYTAYEYYTGYSYQVWFWIHGVPKK